MRGVIDALFWKLHTSYLKNNHKDAKYFLENLNSYDNKSILNEIGEIHFERFTKIRKNIDNSNFQRLQNISTPTIPINNMHYQI